MKGMCIAAVCAALCTLSGRVTAEPTARIAEPVLSANDERGLELFRSAEAHYDRGRYSEAVDAFLEAYRLTGRATLLFAAANCYERWGRYQEAAEHLSRYEVSLTGESAEIVRERIESLVQREKARRERAPIASKQSSPTGQKVTKSGGAASPPSAQLPLNVEPRESVSASGARLGPWANYVLLGTGSVAMGLGLYWGVESRRHTSDAEDLCLSSGLCPESAGSSLDASSRNALLADVSLGIGVAALATGLYFLLTEQKPERDKAPQLDARIFSNGGLLQLRGEF